MTPERIEQLAAVLKQKRQELGLSASEVARQTGLDVGTISRIERGQIAAPQAGNLKEIARVLQIPATDIFAIADLLPEGELPTFKPYLRAKYGDLPDDAMAELEASFTRIAKQHGYDGNGPAPGEDEN
ncbi:helix-turn-helix domain-containing protein [Kribbella sindirgiensis]|uniref:XRE family transcriptional regulator n=1 Tax=Kribbella sindirgiensis TaxID=1124744 RepID=A0A4R0J0R6_9ACTN|nr:helix-turn-helix transcriptional regulator [Kribbella sindirgiensis]TCC39389.1 XRE family transcriptional regulator [Kribbella sindirgiensis]